MSFTPHVPVELEQTKKVNPFEQFKLAKEEQAKISERATLLLKADREMLFKLFQEPAWAALGRLLRARLDLHTAILFTETDHAKMLDARASVRELQRILDLPELIKSP